ncbi:hypothetical protein [[Phormidium] sp. ETS-05]|uniref:hypothetical protein n=1 Tax=[Phormidium] sp. ETS-05 TaxID=222819 RepID=UPI0018EECDE3|nr:hypothetical protein [[Phormidium] sp. ETS-05]
MIYITDKIVLICIEKSASTNQNLTEPMPPELRGFSRCRCNRHMFFMGAAHNSGIFRDWEWGRMCEQPGKSPWSCQANVDIPRSRLKSLADQFSAASLGEVVTRSIAFASQPREKVSGISDFFKTFLKSLNICALVFSIRQSGDIICDRSRDFA